MLVVDPTRKYVNTINGGVEVCTVQSVVAFPAVGINQLILAAITSKKIRVMGWIFNVDAVGVGRIAFRDGSGGTIKAVDYSVDNLSPARQPIVDSGYFETSSGTGLYCDLATTAAYVTVFYVAYTG